MSDAGRVIRPGPVLHELGAEVERLYRSVYEQTGIDRSAVVAVLPPSWSARVRRELDEIGLGALRASFKG